MDGHDDARATGVLAFCAGVGGTIDRPMTAGGRVLTVVGRGRDLGAALEAAYAGVARVRFPGMQWRADIGRGVAPALAGGVP
ncbi:MAG: phosphoribosylglycinamide synthetase C domain-containing protein [Chloroflexota bacterium]